MKQAQIAKLILTLVILPFVVAATRAQELNDSKFDVGGQSQFPPPRPISASTFGTSLSDVTDLSNVTEDSPACCENCGRESCERACRGWHICPPEGGVYGGAEYLFVRPHFSEAMGFVTVSDSLVNGIPFRQATASDFHFSYAPSLRSYIGYRESNWGGEFQFTYWHFRGRSWVAGTDPGAGVQIVDPLGNATTNSGDNIDTTVWVEINVYDMEFAKAVLLQNRRGLVKWSAGVRIADVDQFNATFIRNAIGSELSAGDFSAEFIGAGPRVGFEGRWYFGEAGRVWLSAKGNGSLLVGDYQITAGSTTAAFIARQASSVTKMVPVTELELTASAQLGNRFTVTVGWLFQAWFDLGASGGRFAPAPNFVPTFLAADDSNIMSFDGLIARGELAY